MSKSGSASALSPEYPVLGLLAKQASHGYALHAALQQELGQIWNISQSQTYSILKRLEAQGLVRGSELPQETGPDRYLLQITPEGREHFQRWLKEPSGTSSQALRIEFLTRLYFARQTATDLVPDLIHDQMEEIKTGIRRLQERLDGLPSTNQVNQWALEVRIHQLQGFLHWLQRTRQAFVEPSRKGTQHSYEA